MKAEGDMPRLQILRPPGELCHQSLRSSWRGGFDHVFDQQHVASNSRYGPDRGAA
jgi:hypothetical protein